MMILLCMNGDTIVDESACMQSKLDNKYVLLSLFSSQKTGGRLLQLKRTINNSITLTDKDEVDAVIEAMARPAAVLYYCRALS